MVIDLSSSGFLDSTALGVLVSVHRRLRDRLVIANAQPAVQRLFDITRFATVLRMYASVDEALTALKA
jgi:anti-anti-sigma factor